MQTADTNRTEQLRRLAVIRQECGKVRLDAATRALAETVARQIESRLRAARQPMT